MNNFWIESQVKYGKINEKGVHQNVTANYLVKAVSFADAEKRTIEEVTPYINGNFSVSAVKKSNVTEIFYDEDSDRWYKVKISIITLDEKSGVEKKVNSYILVQADDFHGAVANFVKGMKGAVSDFEIVSVTETNIFEVID